MNVPSFSIDKNTGYTEVAKDMEMGRVNLFRDHNCWKIPSLGRTVSDQLFNIYVVGSTNSYTSHNFSLKFE